VNTGRALEGFVRTCLSRLTGPAVCTPDGANETGASPVGARVEDTLEKQLVNAKCVRVVMAQVTVCSLPAGPWARVEGRCE